MAIALNRFQKNPFLNNPLIVALDLNDEKKVYQLAEELSEVAGGLKIGPRLIVRYGLPMIKKLAEFCPVFVDHKFFDIPSTMESSVEAVFEAGASLATVHASSGRTALAKMAKLEERLNQERPFKILAVTVLTSWKSAEESSAYLQQPIGETVLSLAKDVKEAGLNGLVCSGEELEMLAEKDFFLVVPGIRRKIDTAADQQRTMTPQEAIASGASAIVVGRPIIEAADPRGAAMDFAVAMLGGKF